MEADSKEAVEQGMKLFANARAIVRADAPENEYAFVTDTMTVADQEKAAAALAASGVNIRSKIRISDL